MKPKVTLSQLPRIALCPGSASLPHMRETNVEARYGTAAHKLIEMRLRGENVNAEALTMLASLDDYHAEALAALNRCIKLPVTMLPLMVERAVGWWENGEVGPVRGAEGQYVSEGQALSGTIDALYEDGIDENDPLTLVDWKTGSAESAAHPDRNWQLRAGALLAHRFADRKEPRRKIIPALCFFTAAGALDHDARGEPYQGEWIYGAPLGAEDIDSIENDLRALLARANAKEPQLVRGAHCAMCPARASCPALRAELSLLSPLSAELITTEEQAARVVEIMPAIQRVLDDMMTAARAIAEANGGRLQLSDGRVYVREEQYHAVYDPEIVVGALKEIVGEDDALKAIDVSTSRAAIERAAGDREKAKRALTLIRERGGITREPKVRWERRKVKP